MQTQRLIKMDFLTGKKCYGGKESISKVRIVRFAFGKKVFEWSKTAHCALSRRWIFSTIGPWIGFFFLSLLGNILPNFTDTCNTRQKQNFPPKFMYRFSCSFWFQGGLFYKPGSFLRTSPPTTRCIVIKLVIYIKANNLWWWRWWWWWCWWSVLYWISERWGAL